MGVKVQLAQVLAVLVQRARLVPPLGHTRVVLPRVEEPQVLVVLPVDHLEREVHVALHDVPAVRDRARVRLGPADRVARVDRLVGEPVRDMVVLGHEGVLRQRRPQVPVCVLANHPDGPWAGRRGRALPERAPEDQQLSVPLLRGGIVFRLSWLWVLNPQTGGEEFISDGVRALAGQSEPEVFIRGVAEVDGVDHIPDLGQGWWSVPFPLEIRRW